MEAHNPPAARKSCRPRRRWGASILVLSLLSLVAPAGCKPRYSGTGTLAIDQSSFRPVECHVLGARATGIELVDEKGTRVEVTLPPARLDAFQEIGGPAATKVTSGASARELGTCATLKMRGEGYHEPHRRAASGRVSFACANATGELVFEGCF